MALLNSTIVVFLVSFLTCLIATWIVRGIMRRCGIMDVPVDRKTHATPVAYEGGVAIYLGVICGLLSIPFVRPELGLQLAEVQGIRELSGILLGATIVVGVGVADDLLDLRPWIKLLAQIAVGVMMYRFGFRLDRITKPFGEALILPVYVDVTLTAVWYALLMNGINMIDGLDGLAAGIVAITAVSLAAISMDLQEPMSVLLALVLVGSCLGFLPYNFTPASIFMGDAGSLLLGFMLASITLLSRTKAPAFLALLIPVLAVGLPLFETVFSFMRRILHGQHPFRGDRKHLHHRFLQLGFSQRRTVLMFYYITGFFGVSAYVLQRLEAKATLALVIAIAFGMVLLVENLRYLQKALDERN